MSTLLLSIAILVLIILIAHTIGEIVEEGHDPF